MYKKANHNILVKLKPGVNYIFMSCFEIIIILQLLKAGRGKDEQDFIFQFLIWLAR
jgi:hypothetical protein